MRIVIFFLFFILIANASDISMMMTKKLFNEYLREDINKIPPAALLILGSRLELGDKDFNIKKDPKKAEKFYILAGNKGIIEGYILAANLFAKQKNYRKYVQYLTKAYKNGNYKNSILAAHILSTYYMNAGEPQKAFDIERDLAFRLNDKKAKFLVAIAVLSHEIVSDLSEFEALMLLQDSCESAHTIKSLKVGCSNSQIKILLSSLK